MGRRKTGQFLLRFFIVVRPSKKQKLSSRGGNDVLAVVSPIRLERHHFHSMKTGATRSPHLFEKIDPKYFLCARSAETNMKITEIDLLCGGILFVLRGPSRFL